MFITPQQLIAEDEVVLPDGRKIVVATAPMLPECLAETVVRFRDGSTERFCNFKQLLVIRGEK